MSLLHVNTYTQIATGSGYEQAKAKVRHFEIEEVAVAFDPPTGIEVITEAAHCPLLDVRPDSGPHRYSATDLLVQVCLRPAPVGLEEAVFAVPRNEHRLDPGPDCAGQLGSEPNAGGSDLGQVVTSQPEPAAPGPFTGVTSEDHHAPSHALHFAHTGDRVWPVMNGGKSHRQQACKKYPKALLTLGGIHAPRTHILAEIFRLLPPAVQPEVEAADLSSLNLYAVDVRYADDWREPQRADAVRAMEIAGNLRNAVRRTLTPYLNTPV